ncbi:hypothetical protein DL89DRAFT_270758 [Linderina pennispora]|uniref:Uncharacterized protein n=1 Tax=Linderina pennispora TaxID=61395 RepID=A0A1Y1VWM6_9FUNG|nr:uncharacterized protein DL89DRAFT_270758 [Linderina pennispora]ORX65701.1 hypothetical protein DL89DRAFT_270758 [Linderina pennispora]
MTLFSESAFTIVDFVAQRLIYVAVFLTLSLSSDKERQFARLAKISRAVYPGFIALNLSYFIFHLKAGYSSLLILPAYVIGPFIFFMNPVFWLVYGDDVISLDVKEYRSRRMTPVKDEVLTEGANSYAVNAGFFACLVGFGFVVYTKNKNTQKRLAEGFSPEGSLAETKAEFASEKVRDQLYKQV